MNILLVLQDLQWISENISAAHEIRIDEVQP
jgi:hypothetical protein